MLQCMRSWAADTPGHEICANDKLATEAADDLHNMLLQFITEEMDADDLEAARER